MHAGFAGEWVGCGLLKGNLRLDYKGPPVQADRNAPRQRPEETFEVVLKRACFTIFFELRVDGVNDDLQRLVQVDRIEEVWLDERHVAEITSFAQAFETEPDVEFLDKCQRLFARHVKVVRFEWPAAPGIKVSRIVNCRFSSFHACKS